MVGMGFRKLGHNNSIVRTLVIMKSSSWKQITFSDTYCFVKIVRSCIKAPKFFPAFIYLLNTKYMYIYIYICVCVCMFIYIVSELHSMEK